LGFFSYGLRTLLIRQMECKSSAEPKTALRSTKAIELTHFYRVCLHFLQAFQQS